MVQKGCILKAANDLEYIRDIFNFTEHCFLSFIATAQLLTCLHFGKWEEVQVCYPLNEKYINKFLVFISRQFNLPDEAPVFL